MGVTCVGPPNIDLGVFSEASSTTPTESTFASPYTVTVSGLKTFIFHFKFVQASETEGTAGSPVMSRLNCENIKLP